MRSIFQLSPRKLLSPGFVLLLALAAVTPQMPGAACTPPPTGLVGWWRGEGNGNDMVGSNNAALPASGITFSNAEVGRGFIFSGSTNAVSAPDSAALNIGAGQDFSIEAWIQPQAAPGNSPPDEMTIAYKRYAPDAFHYVGYAFYLANGGQLYFLMGDAPISVGGLIVSAGPDLRDGRFHHVAVSIQRNSTTGGHLFIDGTNALTFDPTQHTGSLSNSEPFLIGSQSTPGYVTPFKGTIDELSFYQRALTNNEIAAIYNAGSAGKCAPGATACTPPPPGIVGWWPADGNANDSIGTNNGSLAGIGATYASGKVGLGFRFDGTNGYVQLPDSAALKPANVTVEAWVWLDPNVNHAPSGENIIFKRNSWTYLFEGYSLLKQSVDNGNGTYTDRFQFVVTRNGNQVIINSTSVAQRGVWYHVAATYNGTRSTLYVNGLAEASAVAGFALDYGTRPVFIGTSGEPAPYTTMFAGIIDEASIYNRALATNEIAAIYNAGSAGKCTGAAVSSGPPAIYNFTPNSGSNGTMVTITGTNFSATAAANIVYFGAVRANVLAASPTSLTVTVPTGAIYAPITVTVGGLIAYANAPFLVTFAGSGSTALAPRLDLPCSDGPGFVVFADLDGDAKPDLLVLGSIISIYQNISTNGTMTAGSFAPRVDLALPSGSDAVTVADVDGDGRMDIVLLNRNSSQVVILKNISTPGLLTTNSFAAPVGFSTGADPRGLAVRDLDADGKPELIVANWGDNTVSVFHNNGATSLTTNSFGPAVTFAVGANPQALAIADLDGDGKPDVFTANNNYATDNSVSILRNTSSLGNISFASHVDLPGMATSFCVAVGDLDGDGKLDLAVSSFINGQAVSVYRNTSTPGSLTTSSFAAHVDFDAGGWGNAVAIGDLDGDGKPDLAVVTQLPDHLSIFKNLSTPGSFTTSSLAPRVDYPAGWNPNGVAIGDLDGDGRPDIAFAVSYGATLSIYQNLTSLATNQPPNGPPAISSVNPAIGTNGTTVTIRGSNFSAIAASNIVYFGAVRADVSTTSANSLTVTVPVGATFGPVTVTVGGLSAYSGQLFEPTFTGSGSNVTTSSFAPSFNLGAATTPSCAVIADLDGDGKPDIAFANSDGHVVSIYRNISTNGARLNAATFAPRVDLPFPTSGTSGNPCRLRAVDLDGDGKLDLIAGEYTGNRVSVFHNIATPGNLTTNSFETPFALIAGSDCRFATAADLDGDGRVDIVALNLGDNTISIFKNTGTTGSLLPNSFAPPIVLAASGQPVEVAIADLDGDGKPDLAVANNGSGTVSIFQNVTTPGNLSTNSFAPRFDMFAGSGTLTVAAVDLDGDGKLDLAVGSAQSDYVSVFRNVSTGGALSSNSFAPRVDFGTPGWMHTISVADFNGDDKPDLGVVGELNSFMAIFQNLSTPGSFTTNSFAPRVDFGTGWNAWGIAAGDLDGDGRPDVVFCNQYDSTLQIYQNVMPFGTPLTTNSPVPPVITSFNPVMGKNGTVVTISGTNFSPVAAANIIYFGAVRAAVLSASSTTLTVNVPSGATYAPITVTVNGLVAYSAAAFAPTFAGTGAAIDTATFAAGFNLPTASGPYRVAMADLDGDGRPDLIVAGGSAGAVSIYQNIGSNGVLNAATFAAPVTLTIASNGGPAGLAAADLDGDGKLDLILTDNGNNQVVVLRNLSTGGVLTTNSFAAPAMFAVGADPRSIVVLDLDGDGLPDMVCVNAGGSTVSILHNTGGGAFARVDLPMAGSGEGLVVGDLDGDGKPDVVATDTTGFIALFRNKCTPGILNTNSFDTRVDLPAQNNTIGVAIGDLDGDGRPELISTAYLPQNMSVYRNLSSPGSLTINSFAAPADYALAGRGHNIALSDFNGDGKTDIAAVTELDSALSLFQNIGSGSFTNSSLAARVDFASGWNAWGLAVGDLDGDGRPDAVFANSYDSTITLYHNQAPFGAPPVITTQPTNQSVAVGGTAAFTVAAQGALPLNYQWSFNGTDIAGATNSTLTLTNAQLAQAGNYFVTVSNLLGGVVSSNAVLTVYVPQIPPAIVSQTPNQVVLLGSAATFSVTASGSDPLSYFWSRNGALIPNATNSSYTLLNAQLSDSGSKFNCLITNLYGSASSTNAALKVIDTISNDLCSGAVVITRASYTNAQSTLKASAFGDPAPDCVDGFGHGVWYEFTAPVAGLLIVDTFGSDFDTGLAIYTGGCGSLTEAACNDDTGGITSQVTLPTTAGATYFILAGGYSSDAGNLVLHLNHLTPPAFDVQPTNQTVVAGNTASFSATLAGALPMSFQWYFNGTPLTDDGRIIGSTTANLSISNATAGDAGSYALAVTNFLGSTNSATVSLTVLVPPMITTQPVGRSVPPGLPTIFTTAASGIPAPGYQWQLNGTNILGANSASYTNTAIGTNDLGFYRVVATNSVGGVTSAVAQLTFGPVAAWGRNLSLESLPPPGLSNVIGVAGGIASGFAVRADGTVAAWGSANGTNVPSSATNVIAVSATGGTGNNALRADGTVVGWAGSLPPALSNIVSVASGFNFSLALRAEGSVVGWGNPPFSTVPAGLSHAVAISAGFSHSLALRSDGTVVAWGTGAATNVPVGLTNITAISAGYVHSLALKANGSVVAWGSGTGTNLPAGLTNIIAISAENAVPNSFSMALRANGTIVVWGDNSFGETNPPPGMNNLFSVAVAAVPNHGLALINDGSPQILQPPVGLTAYTGRDVTLQAKAVGAAPLSYQWLLNGTNVPGATNAILSLPNIQFANAGSYQLSVSNSIKTALSLTAPVNVISNSTLIFLSQTTNGVTNYQGSKIVTGGFTVLGNGPLHYQWFSSPTNKNYTAVPGATNDVLVLDPALAVQSGSYYLSVSNIFSGITSAPVNVKILFARAWGYNAVSNPPVNVTNAIAVATGGSSGLTAGHYLALGADGKVTAWANGLVSYGETNVSALSNSFVTAIAAGYQHSLALKSDGTVYAWGYGFYGQTNPPSGLNSVVAIACGGYHDLALKSDGTVAAWGDTSQAPIYGQATNNPAATNVVAIAAGNLHSFILRADGSMFSWGNAIDLNIIPTAATNVIAIAAGSSFNVALRANGTVVQWGSGITSYPVPASLSNVVAITAAGAHVAALKNDGTVVSWGNAYSGLASNNVPADLANVIAVASGGDHDIGLLGTRAPAFTVQPWNRSLAISVGNPTNIFFAAKCAGVQPVTYQWRRNGTNILGATNDTFVMSYNGQANTQVIPGSYQLVASNVYGVAVSKSAKLTIVIPLADALDTVDTRAGTSLYNWLTSGNAQWFGQTNITHDGVDAARSGGIGALQETILTTTLATNYSGRATFWWKVSSEQFFDTLEFRVNGAVQAVISGEVDWQQASIPVAAGTNVLQWRYSKDASFDAGLDAGFVDQFAFVPDAPIILIQPQPASQTVNLGATVALSVSASGAPPLKYQWRQNGNVIGGNSSALSLSNVGRAQNGTYFVTVTNAGGATISSNAVLKVLVPQLLASPQVLPNGTFQLISTDANGGLLSPSDLPNFEAQTSTNLLNWATLPNALSLTNGMLLLQDYSRTNYAARYYRIIEH